MQRFLRNYGIEDFELDVSDGLFAEGPFPGSPLEALNDRVLDRAQKALVDF